jgi:hypothetical protein
MFESTVEDFLKLDYTQSKLLSGIPLGEQLYTARGSQGFAIGSFLSRSIGGYDRTSKKTDEQQSLNTFIYSIKYESKRIYYQSRSIFNTKSAPAFSMTDREKAASSTSYYSALTSMPMYAKYAERESVKETVFERILIMMKDPLNKKHASALISEIRESISDSADSSLKVYNYLDS